jgi:hypothetical protein
MPRTHSIRRRRQFADGGELRASHAPFETRRHQDHEGITKFLSVFSSLIERQLRLLRRLTSSTAPGVANTKEILRETLVSFVSSWFIGWEGGKSEIRNS